jgi:nitroreductase
MEIFEAIKTRRAIKHYDPNHQISAEEQAQLFELAMQAPSSFNIQHWRLVNVVDKDLREKIREAAYNQAQVTEASMLLLVTADTKAWQKDPARYWQNAPKAVQDVLVPWITPFYQGNEQVQRDEAMRSVGLISQTIMLAVKGMGYDSCPMIGFDQAKVAELIKLPADHVIGMMITVGKALKPAWPKPGFITQSELVVQNTF